jgi:hypothetical protein
MATICAASCGKSAFANTFTDPCELSSEKIIAVGISLCGVDLACPTVSEDVQSQIDAGTLQILRPVKADWSQPSHNYEDVNYSYLAARRKVDSTYDLTVDVPLSHLNADFFSEIDAGDYKDIILVTEDGYMLQPDTSRIDIAVGTGPDGDGTMSQRMEIQWTQKTGQMKIYQGRAPLFLAEDA